MTARIRRDPRAERAQCLVPGGIRPRLVRDGKMVGVMPSGQTRAAPVRRIEAPSVWAVVVVGASTGTLDRWGRQLLGAARMLVGADGGVILAVCEGQSSEHQSPERQNPQDAGDAGADRVISLEGMGSPEKLLAQLIELTDIFYAALRALRGRCDRRGSRTSPRRAHRLVDPAGGGNADQPPEYSPLSGSSLGTCRTTSQNHDPAR